MAHDYWTAGAAIEQRDAEIAALKAWRAEAERKLALKLPESVRVGNTKIGKGCTLYTLALAITRREGRDAARATDSAPAARVYETFPAHRFIPCNPDLDDSGTCHECGREPDHPIHAATVDAVPK